MKNGALSKYSKIVSTVGAITSVEAKSATTIVATFESALPATAVLTLTKGTTDTGVKAVIDEARTTATFTSASKYAVGTYTVTATAGESKQSKDVEIKEQSVQDIVIKSKQALTDHTKKKIYAHYDVVDQYGESMRSSTSVTWTTGSGTVKADKTTGCLTITKTSDEFRYGENVYIVGVDTKSGKSVQVTLPVGMERALDTIKFEGFINKDNKENILETLPKDFTSSKYFLLFTAYDQDGNEIEASKDFTDTQKGAKVTFVADNPTLIKSEFKGGDVYTIKGKKYCSVSVEPGMYIDKGGEVNITAISNTTGNKTTQNFVIGAGAVLKSLSLNVPTDIIADGDQDVNIPFVAKDTEGNDVTNYETIVRSTNSLRLTATQGELVVYETESGSAAIKWNDSAEFGNKEYDDKKTGFARPSAYDGIDRPVSLMTTVIGGESNSVIMNVADKRRPVAISYVKLNDDDNNTITESNSAKIDFFADKVKFVDQYGKVHETGETEWANAFFKQAASSDGFHEKQYGIKVDYSSVDNKEISIEAIKKSSTVKVPKDGKYIVLQNKDGCRELNIKTEALVNNNAVTNNIKYSIVQLEDPENNGWDAVDAENSIDYTIVPVGKLSDLKIKDIGKVRIETDYSDYENGYGNTSPAAIVELEGETAIVANETKRDVVVAGNYEGKTVTIPNTFYDVSGNDTFEVVKKADGTNSTINALTGSAILYRELYDFNTARLVRKDARKDVSAKVYSKVDCKGDLLGTAKTSVLVSDALRYPVSITFYQRNAVANKIDFAPEDTKFEFKKLTRMKNTWDDTWGMAGIIVKDQYGNTINIADPEKEKRNDEVSVEFTVSNIVENAGEYAHLPKSFIVNRNNSDLASLDKVEIKDTFDLTATVAGTGVSTKVSVTVNADKLAKISSNAKTDNTKDDEDLRKTLGYNR